MAKRTTKLFREFLEWLSIQNDENLYEKDAHICIATAFLNEKYPRRGYLTDGYEQDEFDTRRKLAVWTERYLGGDRKYLAKTEQNIYNLVHKKLGIDYTAGDVKNALRELGYMEVKDEQI